MSGFLTTSSTLLCPHGGAVQIVSGNSQVLAGGAPIARSADTFIVAGCAFNVAGAPSPCLTVTWLQPAARSRIGAPTLTAASIGLCIAATGAVQGPVVIAATQAEVQGL